MITKFTNGLVLNKDFEIVKTDVYVDGSRIAAIGKSDLQADSVYNLNGNLLMPSFKNAHTHSAMTFARSYADDLPLSEWLNNKIFPMEAKLTGQDIYALSQVAFLEYLTSGITACFDMYYFPDEMAKASVDFGFRTVMCGAVNNFKESVELLEKYYKKFNSYDELISYKLGFHAEYTTSLAIMKNIARLCEKYQDGAFMHSSETKNEVEGCVSRYKKTPTQLFSEIGLFDYGGGAFHSVVLNEEEMEIYKEKKIWAVINAGSNCKLASGVAPVTQMLNKGIHSAIGTDGPSSNNALDMFREMYLISATQNIADSNPAAVNPIDILKMATVGGAKCMGLNDCDVVDIGKTADLIVLDMNRPNMQPVNNILKNIVYSGSKENVMMTMINGKILYDKREFVDIDTEKIYYNAQKATDRLK